MTDREVILWLYSDHERSIYTRGKGEIYLTSFLFLVYQNILSHSKNVYFLGSAISGYEVSMTNDIKLVGIPKYFVNFYLTWNFIRLHCGVDTCICHAFLCKPLVLRCLLAEGSTGTCAFHAFFFSVHLYTKSLLLHQTSQSIMILRIKTSIFLSKNTRSND